MPVVAVVDRDTEGVVVREAARRAIDLQTDLHVVFVLEVGWFSTLELGIAERVGIPVGLDRIRRLCAGIADRIANEALDGVDEIDDYEAVGLIGEAGDVVAEYARSVDADCIVIHGDAGWGGPVIGYGRGVHSALKDSDVSIVRIEP